MPDALKRETQPPPGYPALPVPQYWNPAVSDYEKVEGAGGAIKARIENAYDVTEDMFRVKSMQKKWRESFGGTTLDTTKWRVVQQGSGHAITVSGGTLTISTGTTANTETILETVDTFTIPCRVVYGAYISQKIANQAFVVELVSVDSNGNADGQFAAAWVWSGNDSTTATNAVYEVQANGLSRLRSGVVNVGISQTSYGLWEIEAFADECWFHARGMDSANSRAYSAVRHQQIPDPNRLYKLRIRAANTATAPASSTSFIFQFIAVMDYSELTAEITASRGIVSSGQSLGVTVTNTPTVNASLTSASGQFYSETTTALGVSGVFSGSSRDHGATTLANVRAVCSIAHQAGNAPGHLVFEQSTDGTTWRETHRIPIPSDGLYRLFEFPIVMRYTRFRFLNGAVAQTLMHLQSAYFKVDGPLDREKTLTFLHTTTALGASASFTGPTLDLGGNHSFNRHRAMAFADQAGTLYFEESRDGTNWRVIKTVPVSANNAVSDEVLITQRYQRVRYVNGAAPQTVFELSSALVRQ